MLPPVDDAVFINNPDFAELYKSLTANILNPDGSTKNDAGAKKRDAVQEELKYHRLEATKQHLLQQALSTTSPPSSQAPKPSAQHRRTKSQLSRLTKPQEATQLPPELLDLLVLLPPFLSRASTLLRPDLEALLSTPPFSEIIHLLPQLTPLVSSHLITQASTLARILHPSTNPSFIHRSIPQIHPTTQSLLATLATQSATLSQARLSATSSLVSHLNHHTDALVILLRALEAKHGPSAYSSELQASQGALAAQLWSEALQLLLWQTRGTVYPPEAKVALTNYRRHLRDAKMRLVDSIRIKETELRDYGVFVEGADAGKDEGRERVRGRQMIGGGKGNDEAKERMMREMGRVWKEMEERLEEIQKDLERLDRS
ncbi:uncharacterized protein BCR38DRAFT_489480 [Pseudomassariella vexata]|uniref:Uncharacterized protein n=1 Tax=Pseudomassariella vexata TaxID=1141098 RepID=A0A1Y2DH35_9PEZI|nr:uncharacterized protein BCR38DRAFT_489480 [Pseudomassariella vexata]ORY58562.1 hypothetical protein BCR38DRAFT_489480 [Pseudomassariella vexata]